MATACFDAQPEVEAAPESWCMAGSDQATGSQGETEDMNTASSEPDQHEVGISTSADTSQGALPGAAPAAHQPERAILMARIARLWIAFVRGQLTLMLVIGVLTWLGLTALGVPGALYLGAAAGLLEIVPRVGPVIAALAAAGVALWKGSTYLPISPQLLAGLVILFAVLLQQLENLLIAPRVMGDALELPALVVLAGVTIGAVVGGVPGAVLATPLLATGREVVRYVRRKKRGENPFPPEKAGPERNAATSPVRVSSPPRGANGRRSSAGP
jgi:hypothetical protein